MSKKRIMVVEDERIIAEDIKRSLLNMGYEVPAIASSGEDAIRKAKELMPDLVLMDIVLREKMNGIDAAGHLRSIFNIPVIYLTAFADEKTLERAKVTEPFGYIIKPFEDRELHSSIEMALYKARIEHALKINNEWLSTVLKSIGDAVIATDEAGIVKFLNPVAEELTGWSEEDAKGKPLTEIFTIQNETTREEIENPVEKVIKEGSIVGLGNHTVLVKKDRSIIQIDDSGAPIKDEDGNIIGVVLVFHDVTERKKIEKELRKRVDELETFYDISVDRELKMKELKEEIQRLNDEISGYRRK